MTKISRFTMVITLMISLMVLAACGGDAEPTDAEQDGNGDKIVMKFTHGTGTDGLWQKTAEKFAESVDEHSDGRVEVEIYPGGQIGSGTKSMEDIQNGLVEATSESVNNITPFSPSLGVFDLPYLFESGEEYEQVIDEMAEDINERVINESGLRVITWLHKGIRAVGTNEKIETIDDLKGLKIRVPKNPIQLSTFEAWDVNATPIAWDETITSLQQGVIDGLELAIDDYESTKIYENLDYISDVSYKYDVSMVVIGDDWFNNQPEDIQEAVLKAGEETTQWARENVEPMLEEMRESMEDHVTYTGAPTDEAIWMEKAVETWPNHYDNINGTGLLEQILEVLDKELPE